MIVYGLWIFPLVKKSEWIKNKIGAFEQILKQKI